MKVKFLGWIVAAALVTVAATAGFQGSTVKIGVVDQVKVFNDSDYAKSQLDTLKAYGQARQDMLQFVDQYRTFSVDDATRFHELSLKANPTAAETTELTGIKKRVQDSDARLKALQTKTTPTPAETTELQELSHRVQVTSDTAQHWSQDAQNEFDAKRQQLNKDGMDKVKLAINQVASRDQYTIIFVTDAAPYGANDITKAVLEAMNKKG